MNLPSPTNILLPLAMLAVSASSAAAAPRAPTGSWYADFGEAQCVATRNYGTAEDPLFLALKLPPLGQILQIGIASKGYTPYATQLDGEIVLDNANSTPTSLLEFGVRKLDQRVLIANVGLDRLPAIRSATSLSVRTHQKIQVDGSRISAATKATNYHLKLSLMSQLMQTLETCAAGLRKQWNVEQEGGLPTLRDRLSPGDLRSLFSSDDYPESSIIKGQTGTLKVAVLVNEQGKVADCTIIETSGVPMLDSQSCAIIRQRSHFKPATGLDGKPAKSAATSTIIWMLED